MSRWVYGWSEFGPALLSSIVYMNVDVDVAIIICGWPFSSYVLGIERLCIHETPISAMIFKVVDYCDITIG